MNKKCITSLLAVFIVTTWIILYLSLRDERPITVVKEKTWQTHKEKEKPSPAKRYGIVERKKQGN